jgi:CheY-like chemotaxis protein
MPADEPLRAEVEQIESAGKRAAELTRQLLLFSRGAEMTAQSVNVHAVITDVERLLRGSLGEHVSLNIEPSALPCFVKVPQPHLEQVLVNLVMNARDAMPAGGVVDIVTSREPSEVGDCVRIVVRDSGSGMSPDVIAHAFEPFFSTKEHGRGTGLGLAITYGIIQKADGRITLASEVGKGTTVTIVLPAAAAPGLTPPPPTPRPEDGRGETVLLVEDEDAVRSGVARLLREHHYDVLCARDAADAEERAASIGDIHVLLTDVIMPGLSGPALATRLRAKMPKMRVVFMSGYTGDALAAHGVTDADVLVKPFDEDALLVRLRQVLGSRGR